VNDKTASMRALSNRNWTRRTLEKLSWGKFVGETSVILIYYSPSWRA
jgi:hypothetical protein